MAARHRLPDETLDLHAIGPVILFDDLRRVSAGAPRVAAERSCGWPIERLRSMSRRLVVEADRRPAGTGECLRHDQRTGVVPAVGIQQRPLSPKQLPIGRGYPVAAVFTSD